MSESLETLRNNMIRNIFNFLLDDCYVYLMTVGYNNFLKNKERGDSFHKMSMCVSNEFVTRIKQIYIDMKKDDPTKLVGEEYQKIMTNTICTINNEGRDFSVSYNNTGYLTYDVVFVSMGAS